MNWIKDTLEYIFSMVRFWIIIQPWESGLKIRMGKTVKVLTKGMYFRIPYFDSVYVQPVRLRVIQNPMQTITTKDKRLISIVCIVGYSITDIAKFYDKMHQPASTLSNLTMGALTDYIHTKNLEDLEPANVSDDILKVIKELDYGVTFEYAKIVDFASVKTFRLIQDKSWMPDDVSTSWKK